MRQTDRSERRREARALERNRRAGRKNALTEQGNTPTVRERFADSIGVSKELTLNVAKITLFGMREITVENYTGVIEYTDDLISLSANPKPIRITGTKLEIKTMSKEIIYATGEIRSIEYI